MLLMTLALVISLPAVSNVFTTEGTQDKLYHPFVTSHSFL